jgi:5-formyltetrahydrofolate cyclo-ligase
MRPSLELQKTRCRNRLKRILKKISPEVRRKKSAKITKKLLGLSAFKTAKRIMVYLALPGEVQTMPFVRVVLRLGKEVYAPVVDRSRKTIGAAPVCRSLKNLKKGAFGILEPTVRGYSKKRLPKFDMILVPGVGFDRTGRRIGRGGGYYDRFLNKEKNALKIGTAFSEQLANRIPAGAKDAKVDFVITD